MTPLSRLAKLLPILLAAMVFWFTSATTPPSLHAQAMTQGPATGSPTDSELETVGENGVVRCSDYMEARTGVILGYIVPCITKTIETSTKKFSEAMIKWLRPLLLSFLVLVITFFGVRILMGGGQIQGEAILLLVKIVFVFGILELIPGTFVPMLYNIMDETQHVVATAVAPDQSSLKCDVAKYGDHGTLPVWSHMDCLVGKLYGITTGTGTTPSGRKMPNMLLASSMFGLLGGFFFGGTFGAILFLACIGVLWTMFVIILRTTVTFLSGYLYASLMLILAPLFLPLVLMRATTSYFEPWWKGILAGILMPVVISSYTMMALLLYDRMLFADDALVNEIFKNDLIKKIQDVPRPLCNMERPGNPEFRSTVAGVPTSQLYGANNPWVSNLANPIIALAPDSCLGFEKPSLEMTNMLSDVPANKIDGESPKDIFTKLFMDSTKLLLLSILISSGFKNVQSLARRIVGSGAMASTLDPLGSLETKFAHVQQAAKQSFVGAFKDPETGNVTSGTAFINRLPHVPGYMATNIAQSLRD